MPMTNKLLNFLGTDGGLLVQESNEQLSWAYQPTDLGMTRSYHQLMVVC